jgi:multiple sugar transport system permease protein
MINRNRINKTLGITGQILGYLLLVVVVFLPIVWVLFTAFKNKVDAYSLRILVTLTMENFKDLFMGPLDFVANIRNTIIVVSFSVIIVVPVALMAAYAFSRYNIIGKKSLLIWVLSTQFIPPVVIVIPFFTLFRTLRMLDTYPALIIVNLSFTLPFAIWLLKGFVDALPIQSEEAAYLEGCTTLQTMYYVILPLAMPGIVTAAAFSMIQAWNEFFFAMILTQSRTTTMTVSLTNIAIGQEGIRWELLAAGGSLVMLPMFIIAFSIRKYFVQGITMGSSK